MSQDPRKLAYTVVEAAKLLSVSRSFVYELIHAGKIETVKIGRSRRITEAELQAFLTRHQDGTFVRPRPLHERPSFGRDAKPLQ